MVLDRGTGSSHDSRCEYSRRAPGNYARVWEVLGEEVAEPVEAIACRPCLVTVSVEAMDGNDARVALAAEAKGIYGKQTYSTIGSMPQLPPPSPGEPRGRSRRKLRISRVV